MKNDHISWDALVDYVTINKSYKERAHTMVIDELGFEPVLRARVTTEIFMRTSLKRFEEGTLSAALLEKHLMARCEAVRSLVRECSVE